MQNHENTQKNSTSTNEKKHSLTIFRIFTQKKISRESIIERTFML